MSLKNLTFVNFQREEHFLNDQLFILFLIEFF